MSAPRDCPNCKVSHTGPGITCGACSSYKYRTGKPRPHVGDGRKVAGLKQEKNPAWKGDAACDDTKRGRARRLYKLGPCEHCGKPGTDRHHRDGDTGNNVPENIAILCRKCHQNDDGRTVTILAILKANSDKMKTPPVACQHCGRVGKRRWRGKCGACNEYLRRTGRPRPVPSNPE